MQAEEERTRSTLELKEKFQTQRQQAYEDDQQRRRLNVVEALAKKKKVGLCDCDV